MSTCTETHTATTEKVTVTAETLVIELSDGRTLSVPLAWYPRLSHGIRAERDNWELIGDGEGIHWPDLDEDISIAGLLAGRHSGESQCSLKRWLEQREQKGDDGGSSRTLAA